MENLPELIAFSQNKLGGIQSFYFNILSQAPPGKFLIKWIFENTNDTDSKLPQLFGITDEIIFEEKVEVEETTYETAKRLSKHISSKEGAILANFPLELTTLHLHRRPLKTVFFICHDEGYLPIAEKFEFLIDVFIAHNIQFYEALCALFPRRKNDVYFIPYGVSIQPLLRNENKTLPLKIVLASRLQEKKGVRFIPVIDDLLKQKGCIVQWTIIGDGPEKTTLKELLLPRGNFQFYTPVKNTEVVALMSNQDIFILPSLLDGLPVALLESMSVGCVPVISEFNKGISQVVTSEIGFVLPVERIEEFANVIERLSINRAELQEKSRKAREKAVAEFDIKKQAAKYFDLFLQYKSLKKPVRRKIINYGGWLDLPVFPPVVRKLIRSVKSKIATSPARAF